MKKFRARRVDSNNGEVHFILKETCSSEYSKRFKDYDTIEIKKICKKEATKPLYLFREG